MNEMIEKMVKNGFSRMEIHDSLSRRKYDHVMATYLLLKEPQSAGPGIRRGSSTNLLGPSPGSSLPVPAVPLADIPPIQHMQNSQISAFSGTSTTAFTPNASIRSNAPPAPPPPSNWGNSTASNEPTDGPSPFSRPTGVILEFRFFYYLFIPK